VCLVVCDVAADGDLLLYSSTGRRSGVLSDIFHARPCIRGVLLHLHPAGEQDVERDEGDIHRFHQGNATDHSRS